MINKKELREDNWVYTECYEKDNPRNGYTLPIQIKWCNNFNEDNYSPIPLTPEILEKCGFKKIKDGWYKQKFVRICECENQYCLTETDGATYSKLFNSLHELQNLYFALTGEELTIDLK